MQMTAPMLGPKDFEYPAIMLSGVVDHGMYLHFKNCLSTAPQQGLVVVEISTLGGDPEIARLMGEDIRFHSDLYPERLQRLVYRAYIGRDRKSLCHAGHAPHDP